MTFLTIFLIVYIVGIVWCKWAVTIIMDDISEYYIISKEQIIKIISWIPIVNLVIGVIATKEILHSKFLEWRLKIILKKALNKIVKNHKGDEVAKELKKIIDQI